MSIQIPDFNKLPQKLAGVGKVDLTPFQEIGAKVQPALKSSMVAQLTCMQIQVSHKKEPLSEEQRNKAAELASTLDGMNALRPEHRNWLTGQGITW